MFEARDSPITRDTTTSLFGFKPDDFESRVVQIWHIFTDVISKKFQCGKEGLSGEIGAQDVGGLGSYFIDIAYNFSDRYRISRFYSP